jgi:hypothetical protein
VDLEKINKFGCEKCFCSVTHCAPMEMLLWAFIGAF